MSNPLVPITVAVTVNAPIATAWAAFTEPKHMTQWNFAIPEWHCPRAENDLRTGGTFIARMEARDGSMGFDFGGVYTDVQHHRVIAYTMGDGRTVRVEFAASGNTTTVTETFDPETLNPREMQQGGWQSILDNYKKHAESIR